MKKIITAIAVTCLTSSAVQAVDIPLGLKSGRGTGIRITRDELAKKAAPRIRLEATIEKLTAHEVETEKGNFTRLSIPGFQQTGAIGSPSLPVMNQLIEVPFGATLEVKVLSSDAETHEFTSYEINAPIIPRQPPIPKIEEQIPFEYEASSYQTEGFQHEALVQVEEVGTMRHVRLALLKVAPVAYDVVNGKIEVRNNIVIEMTLKGADLEETAAIKRQYASPYFDSIYRQAISPESLRALNKPKDQAPCYVIIADRQFEEDLAPFIEWKTQKGFDVVTGYTDTIGPTPTTMQAWIHDMYNNPTEHAAPSFTLFVGDTAQVEPFDGESGGWSGHVSDLYYVAVTDDYIPDILGGRFSARESSELLPQIQKTMEYEKYEMADPSFLKHVVMIAGWDYSHAVEWGWPQINYGTQNYFNAEHGIDQQSIFLSAGSHQNEDEIHAAVNEGCSLVNYTAHGSSTSWADPSFTLSDVDAMTNEGKYPLMIGNCCVTNKFEVGTCFGEALLRADKKGAIGYIGGSNNTYWDEDLWWGNGYYAIQHPNEEGLPPAREETGDGAYDGVMEGTWITSAGMMVAGNLAVEASNTSRKLYYWEIYHLMGDPSLMVYWGMPRANPVEHTGSMTQEAQTLQVKATAGSLVAVSIDGQLNGCGFADASGNATIDLHNLPESGEALVVATGKNLQPYYGKIVIDSDDQDDQDR